MPKIHNARTPDASSEGEIRRLFIALRDLAANVVNVFAAGISVTGGVAADTVTTTGNVTANGQVNSAGAPLMSQPSFNYLVTSGYKATWQDGVTFQFGYSSSSEIVKTSLVAMTAADARKLLSLTPYWGRYVWDDPAAPLKVFFLAEDVQAAGFGPDVAPVVEDEPLNMLDHDGNPIIGNDGNPVIIPVGQAYTINYSQMVVPLIAAWQDGAAQMQTMKDTVTAQATQITTLQAQVQQLAAAAGVTLT